MRSGTPLAPIAWSPPLLPGATVLYAPKQKLLLALVSALALTAASVLLLAFGDDNGERRAAGLFGLLFFGPGAAAIGWVILHPRPTCALDDRGIHFPKLGLVPWNQVEELRPRSVAGRRMLGVAVRDPRLVPALTNRAVRGLGRMNKAVLGEPLHIAEQSIPMTLEEFVSLAAGYASETRDRRT